jgi:hypothetical protein
LTQPFVLAQRVATGVIVCLVAALACSETGPGVSGPVGVEDAGDATSDGEAGAASSSSDAGDANIADAIDCSKTAPAQTPICGTTCTAPCGCGECSPQYPVIIEGVLYRCFGECLSPDIPCGAPDNCLDTFYCPVSTSLCARDGACVDDLDCDTRGNDYPRLPCAGHGKCEAGRCRYECGEIPCRDLAGEDFWPCPETLGWAVAGGRCTEFFGCDSRGQRFYASEAECLATCEP